MTVPEIKTSILDQDTVLLEYILGERSSYAWVVTPRNLKSVELPGRGIIEKYARRFLSLISRRRSSGNQAYEGQTSISARERLDVDEAGAQLSRIILRPISRLLSSRRLLIVADGALQYVPFAALPDLEAGESAGNSPRLVMSHEIIDLPSASVMTAVRSQLATRVPPTREIAILADPVFDTRDPRVQRGTLTDYGKPALSSREDGSARNRHSVASERPSLTRSSTDVGLIKGSLHLSRLPFTRYEAAAIVAIAGSDETLEALDFEASKKLASSAELSKYRIVHFATHGLLNSKQPELSGLVFSLVDNQGQPVNGFLELKEIYNLDIHADLVVLSACETGLGMQVNGEGIIGLTRGFMYAGAAGIVASLWKVDDVATAELMRRFYRGMLKEHMRPAEALRVAQLDMLREKRWTDPYYWAAFTIQGEWR